jgi:hypothetical protein
MTKSNAKKAKNGRDKGILFIQYNGEKSNYLNR